jgi:signal transduction histidine kinase/DNA-binding NarL/FixJ family response regulator
MTAPKMRNAAVSTAAALSRSAREKAPVAIAFVRHRWREATDKVRAPLAQHLAKLRAVRAQQRGGLFRKYAALLVALVGGSLVVNAAIEIYYSYGESRQALIAVQREKAQGAAAVIEQFLKEIEGQVGWATGFVPAGSGLEQRRFDFLRLLRQAPAITEVSYLDGDGREQIKVSRLGMDTLRSGIDFSQNPAFVEARANKRYVGPVYFRKDSEPYLTLAFLGPGRSSGVTAMDINLRFVWDAISRIKVGKAGFAYAVDASGFLIAHPDTSLVLRKTDLAALPHVAAALRKLRGEAAVEVPTLSRDRSGREVLTTHAPVASLGWLVFVDLPRSEALQPVYDSLLRTGIVFGLGLLLAAAAGLWLARRMVVPIRALAVGAARVGDGDLNHRIKVDTGDELEALGAQFNSMATQLRESYASLEHKVQERTRQLQEANQAKSRFLAAASHDLRQPLHALNLFIAQLADEKDQAERDRLVGRIHAAVAAMNELFNALLDISKLDAGVLLPSISEFPVNHLLRRIETTFAAPAREKGLRLQVVSNNAWVRSDIILIERILLNLVSNAVRYTDRGGIVVGCRRHGDRLRLDVCDTGIGIPEDQRRSIFGEFYRLAGPDGDRRGGLGLGLAIVDRLCGLLGHPIELTSTVGRGSRFSVSVPCILARPVHPEASQLSQTILDATHRHLVLVIDDDPLVRDSMRGLLQNWGYHVTAADSENAALTAVAAEDRRPDLIISDYRLAHGKTGFEAIERLHRTCGGPIPAFLISGDTAPERLREASASGYHLLHKPVMPMTLRAMVSQLLKNGDSGRTVATGAQGPLSDQEPTAAPNPAPTPQ